MGTGILKALNRNGAITPFIRSIDRLKNRLAGRPNQGDVPSHLRMVISLFRQIDPLKLRLSIAKLILFDFRGQFNPPKRLPEDILTLLNEDFAYSEWNRIALDLGRQHTGGDYFEFGSTGLYTFCNFLSAFHLSGQDRRKPDVKCFAFDLFGDPPSDSNLSEIEREYFKPYNLLGPSHYKEMEKKLHDFGLMNGRVELIKGYFQDTLNDAFKNRLRSENRRVGIAFLDCNILSSYKTVLDFLLDFLYEEKSFVYLDEYFQTPGVASLFDEFCSAVLDRYGLKARYIRTAGSFGALFVFIK